MKLILSTLLIFSCTVAFAQKQVLYFKNNGLQVTQADSSDYVRVVSPPDSGSVLFNVNEYYRTGKPKFLGKSSTINPLTFEEQCAVYYENGKRASTGSYSSGQPNGNIYLYYPNGQLHMVLNYGTDSIKTNQDPFKIMSCRDTSGKSTLEDGNGQYVDYNLATKTLSEEGPVKNGLREGEWHGSYPAEKVTYKDNYLNGAFTSGSCTTANGTTYTYTSKKQSPEFTGGQIAFANLLKKKVKLPAALKAKGAQLFISFTVSKEGKVTKPVLLGSVSPEADKAILAALNASPTWKPAIQNGLPVDVTWGVPLVFAGTASKQAPAAKGK